MTLAWVEILRTTIALADADHELARESLGRIAELVAGSREPQFLGQYGALLGELERRSGDLVAARAAVDDGLDAIEFCSEDLPRIARLAETGAAIEADAAQRARDLGDADAERDALIRTEGFVARAEACAADIRPVETARLATTLAHQARAAGAADPALDAAAADAWRAVSRPYPAALEELRRAEALVAAGDREAAATQLVEVLATAGELGAPWLQAEAEGLAGRARLALPTAAEDPVRRARRRATRSASRRASGRCSRSSPAGRRTARSARSSTWRRRPRAFMCRGSSPSSTCAAAPRRRRWRIASACAPVRRARAASGASRSRARGCR